MELQEIISVALGTLIVMVIAHFTVFWVVRTLYPPILYAPQPQPIFTPPAVVHQEAVQNVVLPTYEAPLPVEAPRSEGERKGPPPPEDTSIRGNSGVDSTNPR